MTVQNVRSPGASDIIVNTVTGASTNFYASMGAPHTFIDPVTGETITIISEATAVDFAGRIDSGKVVIDAIAPGYVDTRGSLVGDIVVIRPITEWANNLFNTISASHNDDGSIKNSAIIYNPNISDYIQSGGVWSVLTGFNAAMTALVGWQAGNRNIVAAVATRAFTLSKDTYVDVLRNTGTNVFTLVYTEVNNNAASPALAANSIRLGIVVTSGAAITFINRGQTQTETAGFSPNVSAYLTTSDTLGNLIYPADPNSRTIGYRQYHLAQGGITAADLVGLNATVIVPAGRRIKITAAVTFSQNTSNNFGEISLYEGATRLAFASSSIPTTTGNATATVTRYIYPTTGAHTYKVNLVFYSGAGQTVNTSNNPQYMLIELA